MFIISLRGIHVTRDVDKGSQDETPLVLADKASFRVPFDGMN